MTPTDPAGRNANKSGKMLEHTIKEVLSHRGYIELDPDEKRMLVRTLDIKQFPYDKWYVEQARMFESVYRTKFVADFVMYDSKKYPEGLLIESKWQGVPGSVDEKYVFTVKSLVNIDIPAMLVLDGGGARAAAVSWIKRQHKNNVFQSKSISEFIRWANTEI